MVTCPTINQSDSSFFGLLTVSLQEQNKIVSQTKLHFVDVFFFGLLMYLVDTGATYVWLYFLEHFMLWYFSTRH